MTSEAIANLLQPYIRTSAMTTPEPDWPRIFAQLATYLDLILKWNARVNLTAIRTPEEIVRRHFGESLFAAMHLGACGTLLDFGSGAGFPGVPIQLVRPEIHVTLAEARNKKAAFLRETVRTLGLTSEIWSERVESMPIERRFDAVTMRAVDDIEVAIREAAVRAREMLLILGTQTVDYEVKSGLHLAERILIPESADSALVILRQR